MFNEGKAWYNSRTVWGGIIAGLSGLVGLFGIYVDPEILPMVTDTALLGSSFVGGVITVWGRIKAGRRIIK